MVEQPQNKAIYFSRYDKGSFLATCSDHGFELEDQYWPSVEHYFQAHKFNDAAYSEEIRTAASPNLALVRNKMTCNATQEWDGHAMRTNAD